MGKTLICPHTHTDFDAFGSAIGASLLFENSFIFLPPDLEEPLYAFIEKYFPDLLSQKDFPPDFGRIVVVDTQSMGKVKCPIPFEGKEIVVIDHHPWRENFTGATKIIEEAGAASTIVTSLLKVRGIEVPPLVATALLAGIYEDTGYFSFVSLTEKDFQAASFLVKSGASVETVTEFVKNALNPFQLEILQLMISEGEIINLNGIVVGLVVIKSEYHIQDLSMVINHYMNAIELDAAYIVLDIGRKAMIIGRSRKSDYDVLPVIEKFGGKGHHKAASATLENIVAEEILSRLKRELISTGEERLKASDIMFSPLVTVGEGRRIEDILRLFNYYNFNVIPVINRTGKLTGLITRQIVDKLIYHGLGNAKVKDFMLTDIGAVSKGATIEEVKRVMLKKNQRFVPVVDSERRPEGGITRKELIRIISGVEDIPGGILLSSRKDIRSIMANVLGKNKIKLLKSIGRVAERSGMRVFLVGGSVRDIILRKSVFDLDLVVEGDAIEVAKIFAKEYGYKFTPWEKFGAATVVVDEKLHLDFSSARLEYYTPDSISYPKVKKGSLYQDLYRRDFTINAMAASLSPDDFGMLIDPFQGYYDIKKKIIRIIHQLSFIEDPARILRAVRFAGKLDFRIGRSTIKAIKNALEMDIFRRFPSRRLFHEFNRIMEEEKVVEIILLMERIDILNRFFRKYTYRGKKYDLFQKVREVIKWFKLLYKGELFSSSLIYWVAFLSDVGKREKKQFLQIIQIPDEDVKKIKKIYEEVRKMEQILSNKPSMGDVVIKLRGFSLESILYYFSLTEDENKKKLLSSYLQEGRYMKIEITGKILLEMGFPEGPIIGSILEDILRAKINAGLKGLEEEKDYVLKNYRNYIEKKEN